MNEHEALEAVGRLYETWYSTMVRYATRASGRVDTAKECVQEAFLLLYQRLRSGEQIDNPKAWTFAVVRRRVLLETRRESPLDSLDESAELMERLAAPEQQHLEASLDEGSRLFAVLSQREEEVLLLRLQALKYREIADQLGIATQTVSVLLMRALKKLRREMDAQGNGKSTAMGRLHERFRNKETLQ